MAWRIGKGRIAARRLGGRDRAASFVLGLGVLVGSSLAALASPAAALEPLAVNGPFDSKLRLEIFDRTRGEFVDWFNPRPNPKVPNTYRYNFFENKLQLGVRIQRDPVEIFAQLQHSLLANLPGPAQGPGGSYYANSTDTFQEEAFLRQGWARVKAGPWLPQLSVSGGRFLFRDGLEVSSKNPTLQWLKQFRIAERLIGPFDYTNMGRSFDGTLESWDDDLLNVTAYFFMPTTGGFEVNAGHTIPQIKLAGAAVTLKESPSFPGSDARLFFIYLNDSRNVVWVDNRPLPERQADKDSTLIYTIGADYLHTRAVGPGQADLLLWALGQLGHWQSLDHRAWAFAAEVGYQLPDVPWKPWLRGGLNMSSGDDDPTDGLHTTFYQIIPTARTYAQTPFYNLMDSTDGFVQLVLKPHSTVNVRTDVHYLRVTDGADLLYSGGGANKGDAFGFAGLPAGGERNVGFLLDLSVAYKPYDFLTLGAYYGHVFGGSVLSNTYSGISANYAFLESIVTF